MKKNNSRFNGLCSVLIIYFLIMTPFFVSCGSSGGGGNDGEVNNTSNSNDEILAWTPTESEVGTHSIDSDTGMALYESSESEITKGVLFKKSLAMVPIKSDSDINNYNLLTVLDFKNTSNSNKIIKFAEIFSPKIDISKIKLKIYTDESDLSPLDMINNTQDFVSVTDLVNSGDAEIIYEKSENVSLDNSLLGAVAIGLTIGISLVIGARIVWYIATEADKEGLPIIDITPLQSVNTLPNDLDGMLDWINKFLGKYCDTIKKSAKTNNIPARLLATIILNELADWKPMDQTQEIIMERPNGSYGWGQVTISTAWGHDLIHVGSAGEVLDPKVDIVKDSWHTAAGLALPEDVINNFAAWRRLNNPEAAIEIVARNISYLWNKLEEGSPFLENVWAQALLIDPSKGIDRNDPYSNLKTQGINTKEHQKNLEESLAILLAAAYNSPKILEQTDIHKVQLDNSTPWEQPKDVDVNYFNARTHASNVRSGAISKSVYDWDCLKDDNVCSDPGELDTIPNSITIELCPVEKEICDNGDDDDGDKKIDCDDSDCSDDEACQGCRIIEGTCTMSEQSSGLTLTYWAQSPPPWGGPPFPYCKDASGTLLTAVPGGLTSAEIVRTGDWNENTNGWWNSDIQTCGYAPLYGIILVCADGIACDQQCETVQGTCTVYEQSAGFKLKYTINSPPPYGGAPIPLCENDSGTLFTPLPAGLRNVDIISKGEWNESWNGWWNSEVQTCGDNPLPGIILRLVE